MNKILLSRNGTYNPCCTSKAISYPDFPDVYKYVDFGNINESFYGMVLILSKSRTELHENIEFDILGDWEIVGQESNIVKVNCLYSADLIVLKKTKLTDTKFHFVSKFGKGKTWAKNNRHWDLGGGINHNNYGCG